MRPQQFDLIAFDWDGTLYDSTALIVHSIQKAALDLGLTEPTLAQASYVIGMGLREALAHACPDASPDLYPELARRYHYHYVQEQDNIHLFAGVPQMLEKLKQRGHNLAIATGKSRKGLDTALRLAGLEGIFDASRTADETHSKPHPQMLHELMLGCAAQPERTLLIGDTTHDLQMAHNAGCACVAVAYGAHGEDAFAAYQACKPLWFARTVADLDVWLENHA